MRILNSYLRIIHFICVTTTLLTCFVRGSLAEDASRSQKLLTAQQTGSQVWPLVSTAAHNTKKSFVRFTFVNHDTGEEFKQSIQAKLLKGTQEIVGGYYVPGSETAVIFAYIKNINDLQMLNIGFLRKGGDSRIASFAIGAVTSDAAVAAHSAYGRLGAVDGRKFKWRKPFFKWPPLKRRRCKTPGNPDCIPTLPVNPSPVPPPPSPPGGPAPQPPVNGPCIACRTVKISCGTPNSSSTASHNGNNKSFASLVADNDLDLIPCEDDAFVLKKNSTGECRLCMGSGWLRQQARDRGLCDRTITIDEFLTQVPVIMGSGGPHPDDYHPLQGLPLLEAIEAAINRLKERCVLADEIIHLTSQKWCKEHASCQEWRSTDAQKRCYTDPDVVRHFEQLMRILVDGNRFLTLNPQQNDRRIIAINNLGASICWGYKFYTELAPKVEACICCTSKSQEGLTMSSCEGCVDSICNELLAAPATGLAKQAGAQPVFCQAFDFREDIQKRCNELKGNGEDMSHTCQIYVALANQRTTRPNAISGLATAEQPIEEPDPECPAPTATPESEAAPLPPDYVVYECPSGPGLAPSEGDSGTWTSVCQTKNSSGELVDAPQYECERKWNGDTWILSKPCPLT
jgi:hypothetical protein